MMKRREFLKLSLTSLAATALSLEQVGWLLGECEVTENIGATHIEKYLISKINRMPEREVGRIIKIETLRDPDSFGLLMRGLNVNKYFDGGKYWTFKLEPEKFAKTDSRNDFVNNLAFQLRLAFRK